MEREAKKVKLVESNGPLPRTESTFHQKWEITDHKGRVHKHETRAGYGDEPSGRSLNKKYTVGGKATTAREILGDAISTGGVASDGEERHIGAHHPDTGFAFR